jgi:hypothetical protein
MIINIDVVPPEKNDEGHDSNFKECKQTDAPEVIFESSESVGID